jgi:hypothetical protein
MRHLERAPLLLDLFGWQCCIRPLEPLEEGYQTSANRREVKARLIDPHGLKTITHACVCKSTSIVEK